MTDSVPAVGLLFDDTELGGQLRDALQERGARIVHEGAVASLSRELLDQAGVDVLVVNLDDSADDALDHLYDLIEGDRPRVVFNDAQASRSLAGWDRARWARHLAVKVLAMGDLDPPRPDDAREIEAATSESDERVTPSVVESNEQPVAIESAPSDAVASQYEASEEMLAVDEAGALDMPGQSSADDTEQDFLPGHATDAADAGIASADSASLEAELEAMLASGEAPDEQEPAAVEATIVDELPTQPEMMESVVAEIDSVAAVADESPVAEFEAFGSSPSPVDEVSTGFAQTDFDTSEHEKTPDNQSEDLAAELEALLASGELPEEDELVGSGLRFSNDEELPPLHDGNFGVATSEPLADPFDDDDALELELVPEEPSLVESSAQDTAFNTDHLELAEPAEPWAATIPTAAAFDAPEVAVKPVSAPDAWALLDDDAVSVAAATQDALGDNEFGIEKMSAADFLAPDADQVAAQDEPVMTLELMSMEEAVAPKAFVQDHEMVLDELGSALSKLVLLGAAVDGTDSVKEFLAALPSSTRLTFVHTQHRGDRYSDEALVEQLSTVSALPVRLAAHGSRAGLGEVLVVPGGHQLRLRRDGKVELDSMADAGQDPSIDASLTMAANAFGRDALAIVFAGRGTDAVGGSQAIHDRGGQVWVEASSGDHFADMVSGIFAERLVSFSGTSPELAAHLIEVFS